MQSSMSIIKRLIEEGVIDQKTATSVEYEVQSSDKTLEEILIEKGVVTEENLFRIKSEVEDTPLRRVYPDEVSSEALKLIPYNSAEQYKMIPIVKDGERLEVGMLNPKDLGALEALKFLARQGGFSFEIYLVTPSDYKGVIRKYSGLKKTVTKALEVLKTGQDKEQKRLEDNNDEDWDRLTEDAPISKVIDVLLRHALEGEASDVHIEPFGDKLRVRFRVLGELYSSIFLPSEYLSPLVARVKILGTMRIDETRIPQDGRFSKVIDGRKIDLRISTLPTGVGEKVAIRILDRSKGLRSFEDLGLLGRNLDVVQGAIDHNAGLVLITGPTGSGKTTTLYAVLQKVNQEGSNVVTLEDPIEYFMEGINQSQVHPEIDYTFARGLRHVLRQDPDIIMVGEMRDAESANLALHAGLTGHLVLSTLHTTSAAGAIPRLIDLGIEPYLIPVVVKAIVAQRLVRRLCDTCKEQVKLEERMKNIIMEELKNVQSKRKEMFNPSGDINVYKAVGCRDCGGRGYSDRIGVFETINMTDSLSEVIVKGETGEEIIIDEAKNQGAITMRQDAILKALEGLTTMEEALRITKSD